MVFFSIYVKSVCIGQLVDLCLTKLPNREGRRGGLVLLLCLVIKIRFYLFPFLFFSSQSLYSNKGGLGGVFGKY